MWLLSIQATQCFRSGLTHNKEEGIASKCKAACSLPKSITQSQVLPVQEKHEMIYKGFQSSKQGNCRLMELSHSRQGTGLG